MVTAWVCAGAGFLAAVLWFDLMFDVQVRGHPRDRDLPEETLASIAAYYARVTTRARPMDLLIVLVMLASLAGLVAQLADGDAPTWVSVASLVLAGAAIGLAGARTVPTARRLGARGDSPAGQSALARTLYRDHVLCLGLIGAVLVVQLGFAT